jgi:hypothetical protein
LCEIDGVDLLGKPLPAGGIKFVPPVQEMLLPPGCESSVQILPVQRALLLRHAANLTLSGWDGK